MKKFMVYFIALLSLSSVVAHADFSSMNVRPSILVDARVQAILADLTKEYFVDEVRLSRPSQIKNGHVLRVTWGYKMNSGVFCYSISTNDSGDITSIGKQRDCR